MASGNNGERGTGAAGALAASGRHGGKINLERRTLRLLGEKSAGDWLLTGWRERWKVEPPLCVLSLGETSPWPASRRPTGFLASFLLHAFSGFLLCWVPGPRFYQRLVGPPPVPKQVSVVLYRFPRLTLPGYLPRLASREALQAPRARHARTAPPVPRGNMRFDPRVTIVSNPPQPDNDHLTIRNPAFPEQLKAPMDLRVPDLIVESRLPLPPPPPAPQAVAPREEPKPVAPAAPPRPATLDLKSTVPALPSPHLEVAPGPAPQGTAVAPTSPAPSSAALHPAPESVHVAPSPANSTPMTLTTLSVAPIHLKDLESLPAGNRAGAFSIGPAGSERASQTGVPSGAANGATEIATSAGTGVSAPRSDSKTASSQEGNGTAGSSHSGPALSISGPAVASGIVAGTLPPLDLDSLVYRVKAADLKLRAPSVVVSSGPGGGGGLPVYGVLRGGKVYTIYLAMPGKNWVLQYAAHDDVPKTAAASRSVAMQIPSPIAPPVSLEQFDFHRPSAARELAARLLVLRGLIRDDGSVANLEVLKGVEPTLDETARAAFARWKFRPALRNGKAVAVEILVGIPAMSPGEGN